MHTGVHPTRLKALQENIPELFKPGRLLNIGANRTRFELLDQLVKVGHTITLLEIWPRNIEPWINDQRLDKVVRGDVVRCAELAEALHWPKFDIGLWWHGPEHIEYEMLPKALKSLEIVSSLVVLGCPYGRYPQGEHQGNPYDRHRWSVYPNDLELHGYTVKALGKKDDPDGGLIAWKHT